MRYPLLLTLSLIMCQFIFAQTDFKQSRCPLFSVKGLDTTFDVNKFLNFKLGIDKNFTRIRDKMEYFLQENFEQTESIKVENHLHRNENNWYCPSYWFCKDTDSVSI